MGEEEEEEEEEKQKGEMKEKGEKKDEEKKIERKVEARSMGGYREKRGRGSMIQEKECSICGHLEGNISGNALNCR